MTILLSLLGLFITFALIRVLGKGIVSIRKYKLYNFLHYIGFAQLVFVLMYLSSVPTYLTLFLNVTVIFILFAVAWYVADKRKTNPLT